MQFNKKIFNDHHLFTESDFQDFKDFNIVMTEKDAVKCKKFARSNFWYLPINADVDEKLFKKLIKKLRI
jgi:tetraacyldisaccharide 4'-kinase